ncbi:hypothetical protein CS0771_03450 [Catellatospora sp. IY07-71]|nr:hypothetical protein CS0771_03450 [Catellatospora sp. IY07-71]
MLLLSGLSAPAGAVPADSGAQQKATMRNVAVGEPPTAASRSPKAVARHQPQQVRWPQAGTVEVDLPAGRFPAGRSAAEKDGWTSSKVRAGGSPVWLSSAAPESPAKVRSQVLDRAASRAAGYDLIVRLDRVDGRVSGGPVDLALDVSGFKGAYGGDWSDRLRMVVLPACALSAGRAADCRPQPLVTSRTGDVLSAEVPLSVSAGASSALVALSSGAESGSGDFGATSMAGSASWSAGSNAGGFAWSYGMRVPPALGGPAPSVKLSYSSQGVDGRTSATNNQPSWIGEGFEWSPGFIERRYISCSEDMGSGANNTQKTGDQCWRGHNATMSLNGRATELIFNATDNRWHGLTEDGSKIERRTGATNGDNDGEHWVVTTTDGTTYYFGLNRLQGWTSGKSETKSVQTVPVFGNHSGDPCHQSAFTDSDCAQGYRWNLDYVVDPHGNTMSLWWERDTNKYGRNGSTTDLRDYVRDAWLDHVDYGTHQRTLVGGVKTDTVYTALPVPMRVNFVTGDRCLTNCTNHSDNWSDTPWDLSCTASPCDDHTPTFWSTKRLRQITTQVWNAATSAHRDVEQWTLTHSFPDPGDGTRAGMWLDRIGHKGLVGTEKTVPDIKLDPVMLNNRVDTALSNGLRPMNWARLAAVTSESGGVVGITYAPQNCTASNKPTPHTNDRRCYPVRWAPEDLGGAPGQEITDWFHKYVVEQVTETDGVLTGAAASPSKVTRYEYLDGAAWRFADDDAFTKDNRRTWNQWRGYGKVRTFVGTGTDQVRSETRFFRGMHGDKATPTGGTRNVVLTDTRGLLAAAFPGEQIHDLDEYAGMTLESMSYDSPTGDPMAGSVSKPWRSDPPTASRTIDSQTVHARFTGTSDTWQWSKLDGGRADRVTRTSTTLDTLGMPTNSTEHGDLSVTGDEQCTATDYARNTNTHLLNKQSRIRMWALTCAVALTAGRKFTTAEIISEVRTSYDDQSWNTAPIRGEVTRIETLKDWVNDAFVPLVTARSAFDDYGRVTDAWDVDGNLTTTAYTPTADGPVTTTTTVSPKGWQAQNVIEPAWGATLATVDVTNNRRTDVEYDALGRVTKVWRPGRSKSLYANTPTTWHEYAVSNTAPSVIHTRNLSPNGTLISSYTFYDGLMRTRQTQSPKADGTAGAMVADTFYDTAGRVWRTFGPYPVAAAASTVFSPHPASDFENIDQWTKVEFDGAGRAVEDIRYYRMSEQFRTSNRYPSGDRTEVLPPEGGIVTATVVDAQGRTRQVRQHHGLTTASGYDATNFDYNAKGQQTRVTNQAGTAWVFEYDLLGRPFRTTDPDKGVATTTYDDAGRITSITDSRPVTLRYTYDEIGRKTGVYNGTVAAANRLTKFEYDGLANAKGMLTSSTRYVGGETGAAYQSSVTALSPFGTVSQKKITIPATETGFAGEYVYDYGYKANGAPASTRMPAIGDATYSQGWETLTTTYTATGLPQKLTTGATSWLVTDTSYTELGELGVITLRDQTANPQLQIGHTYDAGTRLLKRILTTRDTAPNTVSDVNISYNQIGGITGIAEASAVAGVETQCFTHDYLQRLTEAWTPTSGDCEDSPTLAGLGGPAKYWTTWTIDAAGNRTKQVQHITGGDLTTKYVHPAATAAQPHTLTKTTDANDVTTGSYTYDNLGNTRTRPTQSAGTQTLTWDPEGRLASSTDTTGPTTYIYDADGNRLIRKDPAGKTLYLPGQEIRTNVAGTAVISCTRYYGWAGKNIAIRSSSAGGNSLTWMVADRHNTTNLTVASTGTQAVAVRWQDPYGNQRGGTAGTWLGTLDKGFVAGTKDNTGLTHIGAREYDPKLGRFISVDPVLDTTDAQQMQGYSYARNSPVIFSDPDGLKPFDDMMPTGNSGKSNGHLINPYKSDAEERAATANAGKALRLRNLRFHMIMNSNFMGIRDRVEDDIERAMIWADAGKSGGGKQNKAAQKALEELVEMGLEATGLDTESMMVAIVVGRALDRIDESRSEYKPKAWDPGFAFNDDEFAIAFELAMNGHTVESRNEKLQPVGNGTRKVWDAYVDNIRTEFKTPDGNRSKNIQGYLSDTRDKQATRLVIYANDRNGLEGDTVQKGIRDFLTFSPAQDVVKEVAVVGNVEADFQPVSWDLVCDGFLFFDGC